MDDTLIKTALKSYQHRKYAALIIHRKKVISTGFNYLTKHSNGKREYKPNKYSVHAERNAIMSVKNKHILPKCKILIIKIKQNEISPATPCSVCQELLDKYKLKAITIDN